MTRENVCQGDVLAGYPAISRTAALRGWPRARRPCTLGAPRALAGWKRWLARTFRARRHRCAHGKLDLPGFCGGCCAVAGGAAVVVAVVTVFDGGGRDVVVVAQVGSAVRRRSAPDGGGSRGACGPGGDRVPGPFAHAPHTPTPGPVRDGPGRPGANPIARPRLIGALPGRGHGHSIPHGFRPSTTPRTIHSAPARTHRARRTARERHRDQWPSAHLTQERRHCARAGELAYQP